MVGLVIGCCVFIIIGLLIILKILCRPQSIEAFKSVCNTLDLNNCTKNTIADSLNDMYHKINNIKREIYSKPDNKNYVDMHKWYLTKTIASRMNASRTNKMSVNSSAADIQKQIQENSPNNGDKKMSKKEAARNAKLLEKAASEDNDKIEKIRLETERKKANNDSPAMNNINNMMDSTMDKSTKKKSYNKLFDEWSDLKKSDIMKDKYSKELEDIDDMSINNTMRSNHRSKLLTKAKTANNSVEEVEKINAMNKEAIENSIKKEFRSKVSDKAKKDAIAIGMLRKLSKSQLKSEISIMKKALTQEPMNKETKDMPNIPGM